VRRAAIVIGAVGIGLTLAAVLDPLGEMLLGLGAILGAIAAEAAADARLSLRR